MKKLLLIGLGAWFNFASAQVVINEIASTNNTIVSDADGDYVDWIELYNTGASSVNLQGYFISDDVNEQAKWIFPNVSIAANDRLLIFASGKDRTGAELHTNFKLSYKGEIIVLSNGSGTVVSQVSTPELQTDHSYGRSADGSSSWCLFNVPTPNSSNSTATCYQGYEAAPVFSQAAGFYGSTQSVSLSSTSGQIRYTLDGSTPTASSPLYSSAINIDSTAVLKARTFSTGSNLPSATVANTYFINESSTLPVISVSTDSINLWDYNNGIYVMGPNADTTFPYFGANFWQDWEKPVYLEYFDAAGTPAFELPAGVQIHGGYSRALSQKSLRIHARDEYALSDIDYRLFPDRSVDEYKNFILRNGGQDNLSIENEGNYPVHFRDVLLHEAVKNTHNDISLGVPHVVFLNGQYWGIYNMRERQDEHWVENNKGVAEKDQDLLEDGSGSNIEVIKGSADAFLALHDFIINNNMSSSANYQSVKAQLDIKNFIDYFATQIYANNPDWINDNYAKNIKFWRSNDPAGKWRFMLWDTEAGMGGWGGIPYTQNRLAVAIQPLSSSNYYSDIFKRLLINNTGFKNNFVNRYADLLNTVFTPENMRELVYQMKNTLAPEMTAHTQKWGSDTSAWSAFIDDFAGADLIDFIDNRPIYARNHIETELSLNGQQEITLNVSPAGAGKIKINTIIPDTHPWKGIYFDGVPVEVTAVANPGYQFDHWQSQALVTSPDNSDTLSLNLSVNDSLVAYFTASSAASNIVFNEINYNPDSTRNAGDWAELHNAGTADQDISGWVFKDENDGNSYTISAGTILKAGEYLVLARNVAEFQSEYPAVSNVIGPFVFGLSNGGDSLRLFNDTGQKYLAMAYQDTLPWPVGADGYGRTMELTTSSANPNLAASWFNGCVGGSPGKAFSPCTEDVIVTEINYNSSVQFDVGDWVEIYNRGSQSIDLTGWSFRDEKDSNLFVFPANTTLAAGNYLVILNDADAFTQEFPFINNITGEFPFGLSGGGDAIRLYDSNGRLYQSVVYDDDAPWPAEPDGNGYTLELNDYNGDLMAAGNWFTGCYGGSPGTAYDPNCPVAVESIPENFAGIKIYPNPFSEEATVEIEIKNTKGLVFTIFDLSGKKIMERPVNEPLFTIEKGALAPGIYFYHLTNKKAIVAKGKLIVQ